MRIEKSEVTGDFDVYVRYEHSPDFSLTLEELDEMQRMAETAVMREVIARLPRSIR